MSRSFKSALYLALILILSSCATQKRCFDKFPCVPSDTIYTDVTVYKDTIIYRTVPADTIRDSIKIVLPCPEAQNFKSDTVKTKGSYSDAKAFISNQHLKVVLTEYETVFEFKLDSAIRANTKTITIYQDRVVPKKYVPAFYKASLFVNIVLILLFIVGIYLSLRR